jgi:hypothetical protein
MLSDAIRPSTSSLFGITVFAKLFPISKGHFQWKERYENLKKSVLGFYAWETTKKRS